MEAFVNTCILLCIINTLPGREKYPLFDKATAEFEASARCRKLSLPMHMLAIIQRLPKYILLLNQYKKHIKDLDYPDNRDRVKHGLQDVLGE